MTTHIQKAAEHAEHAGSHMAAAEDAIKRKDYLDANVELLRATVETNLSIAQRLAELNLTIEKANG